MTVNVAEALRLGVEPFRVRLPLLGSEWADEYFYLSPESSGIEGRWKTYPYQVAILNWMTSDDIEEINWQKSRRVGYTKCLLAAVCCLIEQKSRSVAIWQPTDGDAEDFSKDEVSTILRDVPIIGSMLKCPVDAKSKYNTIDKKVFHGATLDIKGGKSARNFRRMTKDVAVYDELSGFDVDIDGEGSAVELGDGRLDQAPFPKSIRGSTPKVKGTCQIEAAVDGSDMVFYRYVRCVHCGELQRLEFSRLKWDNDDPKTAHYVCRENGCVLLYRDYPKMDAEGRWQTLDGHYYVDHEDRFYGPDDQPIEKPRRIGAKIWAGYSYLRPWSYIVDKWITASRKAKIGNITTLKSVVNTLLGETWEEQGDRADHVSLLARCEQYEPLTVPDGGLFLSAGVDTQNDRLAVMILAFGRGEECWVVHWEELYGDPAKDDVWKRLDQLLYRSYRSRYGDLQILSMAVDTGGHRTQDVYNYTRQRQPLVMAIKGRSERNRPIVSRPSLQDVTYGGETIKAGVQLWPIGTDTAKSTIFSRLKLEQPGPGYVHFYTGIGEEFFLQLTAEKLTTKYKKGFPYQEWVKVNDRNEALDCFVYAYAAAVRAGVSYADWDGIERSLTEQPAQPAPVKRKESSPSRGGRW